MWKAGSRLFKCLEMSMENFLKIFLDW